MKYGPATFHRFEGFEPFEPFKLELLCTHDIAVLDETSRPEFSIQRLRKTAIIRA
jgi:hypothetical protein